MGNLKEGLAYLQGLTKGLNVTDQSPEGKVFVHMLNFLAELVAETERLQQEQEDLADYIETIDEHVADLENEIYGQDQNNNEYDYEEEDEDLVEVECPNCHETVTFSADLLTEEDEVEVSCPDCGKIVFEQKN